jgi:hypothetical protein
MNDCHLVAYRQAGFHPACIWSRSKTRSVEVAARHQIPKVHATAEDLFQDPQVEVLDFAVPPDVQPELILLALKHARGRLRGILAQKPLALTVETGRKLVEACEHAGVKLAVNQNMRYDQSIRATKHLLNRGDLGDVVLASICMRAIPHWMPWAQGLGTLSTFVMSIHHLDTFRYWLGMPQRVLASTRPDPRTKFPHTDGINLYILEYEHGPRATAWDDVWAGPAREGAEADLGISWRIEGTTGLAQGTIGWPKYPQHTPSTLEYTTIHSGGWVRPSWTEAWFPEAFIGTMAQLLCALETDAEPEINGRDNLLTLALCEAVAQAAKEHRVVTLANSIS